MSRNRSRVVAAVSAAAALVLLAPLAGCAPTGAGSGEDGDVDGSTITISTIAQLKDQFQVYADAYMKEHPDREVKVDATISDFAQYTQKLATQRLSGSMPDVFFNADSLANTFAADDVALDLAPYLESGDYGLELDSFLPQFVDQYRPLNAPETITGLPVSADSTALVYNKTLFDEVGVTEYPQPDWTWEDFARVAAEIQEKSGGRIFGTVNPLIDGSSILGYGPVLAAHGVSIYDPETNSTEIGSPESVKAFELLMSLYGKGSAPFTTTLTDPALDFTSGTVAMAITSRGAIATTREAMVDYDWDVTETPTVEGQHISGGGSYGLSVGAASKNRAAALAFLGWFYSTDGGLAVAQTPEGGGIIPPTQDGLESGIWSDVDVPANIGVFAKTAKDAVLQTQLPGASSATLNQAVATAIQEVQLNGADPATAFATAAESLDAALQQESTN